MSLLMLLLALPWLGSSSEADEVGRLDLGELKGKVVVLEVMETWCGPCKSAIPTLNAWHKRYAEQGLYVVAAAPETADALRRYREATGFEAHLAVDEDGATKKRFEVEAYPTFIVLDRAGEPRARIRGAGENLTKVAEAFTALIDTQPIPDGVTFGAPPR